MSAINKQIESRGLNSVPMVHHYPPIRGGTCTWCGVIDKNVEAIDQYKLCSHYRGMNLHCTYCPPNTNADEVIRRSELQVMDSPTDPNQIIVVCDTTECVTKFRKKYEMQ